MKEQETILFYINSIRKGGAERVLLQLADNYAKQGYKAKVVTSFNALDEYSLPDNVERISLEQEQVEQSRLKRNYSRIKKLRDVCKKEQPIAVISFMAEPNVRAIFATIGLPVKNIISVRNDPKKEYPGKAGKFIAKWILPLANGCVFQTEDAKKWFPKKLQKKSEVIFNAVDQRFFEIQRVQTANKNIVTLGRLCEQKNHEMLIKSFANIKEEFPDRELHIYGIGHLEQELTELINELSLQDSVILKGLTNNSAKVLAEAEVFVLSSDYEGMPNALLEALAVGVPAISTDCPCGGPKMVIENNDNGMLVEVGNQQALEKALRKLLSNKKLQDNISKKAKKDAEVFSPNKVFIKWNEFINRVLEDS